MGQQVTTKNAEKMPEYMYFTEVLVFLCRPIGSLVSWTARDKLEVRLNVLSRAKQI